jgi:hypothetical protein
LDYLDGKIKLMDFYVAQEWTWCETNEPMLRHVLEIFKITPGERSCINHTNPNDPSTLDFLECEFIPESETTCQELEDFLFGLD